MEVENVLCLYKAAPSLALAADKAQLLVRVLSREEKEPLPSIRLFLIPSAPEGNFSASHVDGSQAKLGESPKTDEVDSARFILPVVPLYKVRTMDPERAGSVSAEVRDGKASEHRVVVLEGRWNLPERQREGVVSDRLQSDGLDVDRGFMLKLGSSDGVVRSLIRGCAWLP